MAPAGSRFPPYDVGWRLGRAGNAGPELWVPYHRTTCVIAPQGSGKTLDLLVRALLGAPGAALVTLTKPEDLFLTLEARQRDGRPILRRGVRQDVAGLLPDATAITGLGLDDVLMWVANPKQHPQPEEILRTHPDAAPLWDGLPRGALNGDDRTAGNTITTAAARIVEKPQRGLCVRTESESLGGPLMVNVLSHAGFWT